MSKPRMKDGIVTSRVNIASPRSENFWVQASNQVGQFAISKKLTIRIIEFEIKNFPPFFMSELEPQIVQTSKFVYKLPEIYDINVGDIITVTLDQEFASVEDGYLLIDASGLNNGKHSIKIELKD